MKCFFQKSGPLTLYAADPHAEAFLGKLQLGRPVSVEAKTVRNIKFHRKFFSLLNLAFDMWEPAGAVMHRGNPVNRDFDSFRNDILILAGHYETVFRIDGTFKLVAKSISFASCEEVDFERVYKAVLDVTWERIFRQRGFRSEQEVENAAAQLLSYG